MSTIRITSGKRSAAVPEIRRALCNGAPLRAGGDYVLHWMIAARRTRWNFALDRAVEYAQELGKPLVVLEALRVGHPWASDRLHRFVIDGMRVNAQRLAGAKALYYPYVEREAGQGSGLLEALAERACVVVTDDFPCFFLPRMVAAAAARLPVRVERVDSNGLLPLRATDRVFTTAYSFRRFLQGRLREHLDVAPTPTALAYADLVGPPELPPRVRSRWPAADDDMLSATPSVIAKLSIDHSVAPCSTIGGAAAAEQQLAFFLDARLRDYAERRNRPEAAATSGLSPYLHFGHLSAHEVLSRLAEREQWTPKQVLARADGKRSGWWGMSESAEAFLDQVVTWRELGYNLCAHRADYAEYDSLPDWACRTLAEHAKDRRERVYDLEAFERARTHDPLWNAAQRQLVREGTIHSYLRMLWGKKILEWSASPREAADVMITLNDKYALDGRDPNSYSGIFWCLGRYDRPWGPERPVFGKVRYMTSANTARKYHVGDYLARYASDGVQASLF
jgi:deoxyribodipyrimidine photo-lyase